MVFKEMDIIPSSNIRNIWLCQEKGLMAVEFHNAQKDKVSWRGDVYFYKNIPDSYENIINDEIKKIGASIGSLFNKLIRSNRLHPFMAKAIVEQEDNYDGWDTLNDYLSSQPDLLEQINKFAEDAN